MPGHHFTAQLTLTILWHRDHRFTCSDTEAQKFKYHTPTTRKEGGREGKRRGRERGREGGKGKGRGGEKKEKELQRQQWESWFQHRASAFKAHALSYWTRMPLKGNSRAKVTKYISTSFFIIFTSLNLGRKNKYVNKFKTSIKTIKLRRFFRELTKSTNTAFLCHFPNVDLLWRRS